ncbi:MAG: putative metal-dependent hydrolase [Acidobacteria bacterium]|nr:MAG: putative metal-dependent hydrolase [Acidobacteriota bacterium]REK01311.1 MAG: putative metal-dependent hydrolase [Acidobacteriota bacterium]REK14267.1 MAG: putative metal-dependent hydrolase [Acidobacteriota bacterium]REK44982.1 MAG: putative metal-dependent hydrolase [Acidobacteriota bacterium]
MSEELKYPIGGFRNPSDTSAEKRVEWISDIRALPGKLAAAADGLTEEQIDTPYREGGWTVRQVIHHVADSHVNAMCRFKLALTEEVPTIKTYVEGAWAELGDTKIDPGVSLQIIEGVHARLEALLESLSEDDFARKFNHPEVGEMSVAELLALYSWHSKHHTAHITALRERSGW